MSIHSVKVNQKHISKEDIEPTSLDIIKIDQGKFQCLFEQKSYSTNVVEVDLEEKRVELLINGQLFVCDIQEEIDVLIADMSLTTSKKKTNKNLISSMPGLVLTINVSIGDEIKEGDQLMILEAMKMENVLKAGSNGIVKAVNCTEGEAVEKRQLLIEIE